MADAHKPRHIRDIAHLYISRLQEDKPTRRASVVVTGTVKECFPGYHAANLAAGLSRIGHSVRLVELSGLWPCSAHFLSLPSRIYLKIKTLRPEEEISALAGVAIRFSIPTDREEQGAHLLARSRGGSGRAGPIDVYHLPPAGQPESLKDVARAVAARVGPETPVLLLAANRDDADAAWARTDRLWENFSRNTVLLNSNPLRSETQATGPAVLGYVTNWRQAISDAMPCVIRDPGSHLSRAYLSICETLAAPSSISKGRHGSRDFSRPPAFGRTR